MNFRIISWATAGAYEEILKSHFLDSLIKLEESLNIIIDKKLYIENSTKNWQRNTNLKPEVIEKSLNDTDKAILCLDADSRLHEYPKLFDDIPIEYDCAFFYLNWNEWYKNGSNKIELCSGTLFFRNREICIDLIKAWKIECKKNRYNDQKNLEIVLKNFEGLIKIYKLPYEYCYINSLPDNKEPYIKCKNPVIVHHQISRKLRNKLSE